MLEVCMFWVLMLITRYSDHEIVKQTLKVSQYKQLLYCPLDQMLSKDGCSMRFKVIVRCSRYGILRPSNGLPRIDIPYKCILGTIFSLFTR